jgi:CRP-like cAMP-binding protein
MAFAIDASRKFHGGHDAALLRRLAQFAVLSPREIDLVRHACTSVEEISAGSELFAEGNSLNKVTLLVSGWACRQRVLLDGRRQIFGFILPGDLFGSCLRPRSVALTTAVALTSGTISDVTFIRDLLLQSPYRFPGLASALASLQSLHEGYLLDHLMRLGRQTAYERVAHLLLELNQRSAAVGLADGASTPLPLTQEILADALGLSIVHINRTLQHLRRDRLVDIRGSSLRLLDADQLMTISDYQPPCTTVSGQRPGDVNAVARAH